MCIAIYKPKDKSLSREVLERCFINNPDGAGFAFAKDGQLYIQKGYFTFDNFWEAYSNMPENVPAIIHFRIGTSGKKDETNCHPWAINEDIAIIHNGVLGDFAIKDDPISDTGHFTQEILLPLINNVGPYCFHESYVRYLVEAALGTSKMISLDKNGNFVIFNSGFGNFVDTIWFSNTSHEPDKSKNNKVNAGKSKPWGSQVHITFHKNQRMAVVRSGDISLLTEKEITIIRKAHKGKVKKLVAKGILRYVPLTGNDDGLAYLNWLSEQAALKGDTQNMADPVG